MFVAKLVLSAAFARPRCLTPELRASEPDPLARVTEPYRPASAGFVQSQVYPFRVHYRRVEDVERIIDLVVPSVETSWAVQIEEVGWPAPAPDGLVGGSADYDIYLTEVEGGGAYVWGWGPDVIADDDWYSVTSFMAIDEGLSDSDMLYYVAHELNHVSQYTIDAQERNTFVWESIAEVMSQVVDHDPAVYIDYGAIPDFQEFPFLSLGFDGYKSAVEAYDRNSYYEYGGIVFGMFLEERYGQNDGLTSLALWEGLAQTTRQDTTDYVDSLRLLEPSGSLAALYTEFAVWRMFTGDLDDGAHFRDGGLWGTAARVGTEEELTLRQADGYRGEPVDPPYDLGTNYYVVELGPGSDQALRVEVDGGRGAQWGIAWAVWYPEGPASTGTVVGGPSELLVAEIPLTGGTRVQVGVVNAGPVDMVANGDVPRRSFELSMDVVEPSPPDPGPSTDTGETTAITATSRSTALVRTGCGCSGVDPAGSWLLGALVPLLLRRARR